MKQARNGFSKYECMLILQSEITEAEEKKIFDLLDTNLKNKGKILKKDKLGKKTFVYPIKKQKEGIYWLLKLEMVGKELKQLTNKLNMENSILRFLFLAEN